MCMFTLYKDPVIADHDIKCYKVVYLNYSDIYNDEPFKSMFYSFRYGIKKTYRLNEEFGPDTPVRSAADKEKGLTGVYIYTLNKGFHSYSSMTAVLANYSGCRNAIYEEIILKCVIPEGSVYYKGMNGELCSDTINVVGWQTADMPHDDDRWIVINPWMRIVNKPDIIK